MIRWFSAKIVCGLIAGFLVIGLLAVYPPFYFVPIQEANEKRQADTFNASSFADRIWKNELAAALDKANNAGDVLNAIRHDRQAAKNRYARVVGLGGPHHYFLKGTGKITAISNRQIEISLDNGRADPEIILKTSMIFGNEVLDATQIITRSQFQRTNDYNVVSAEVNKIVETRVVQPFLEQAAIGTTVHFVGCSTKIMDDDPLPIPMHLVPVKLEAE